MSSSDAAKSCSVFHSGSRDSEEPLDRKSNSDQWTHPPPASTLHPELVVLHEHTRATQTLKTQTSTAAELRPAENNVLLHESKSSPRSGGVDKTRTKGPTLMPQQPTQAAGPTEPPFIGDTYMSEDIPPQTVSSILFSLLLKAPLCVSNDSEVIFLIWKRSLVLLCVVELLFFETTVPTMCLLIFSLSVALGSKPTASHCKCTSLKQIHSFRFYR